MKPTDFLFPFPKVRPVQREMMEKVYDIIRSSKHLIVHAPTGIGKTSAAICPALVYALEHGMTIFFLTPKHSQHKIVIETLQRIKKKYDVDFGSVDIIGKRWLCNVPGAENLNSKDFQQLCKSLKEDERCKYYNATLRAGELKNEAKLALEKIRANSPMHVEDARKICKDLCAYEVLLKLAKDASIVVCDYYHLFSPVVASSFLLKTGKTLENSILIVDEAQNLPTRIMELLSERISTISLERAIKEASKFGFKEEKEDLQAFYTAFNNLGKKKLKNEIESYLLKEDFVSLVEKTLSCDFEDAILEFEQVGDIVRKERLKSYCGAFARFLDSWQQSNERYTRIIKKETSGTRDIFAICLYCLDPSITTGDVINSSYSTIAMSGTLTPTFMYRDILGFDEERTELVEYPSVFPKENRLNLIVPGITSKYSRRGLKEYEKFAEIISRIVNASPPNVAVFFPCYEIMNEVVKLVKNIKKDILIERSNMNKEKRTKLLSKFKRLVKTKGAVLFGVSGGSFAEGVDYPENVLKCVIIAGLPLERPDLRIKSLINYYQQKFNAGWTYGYIFPAIRRTMQAAGRCIRSANDKGVIVFMDERFLWRNYLKAFPRDFEFRITKEPERLIKEFWRTRKTMNSSF
jgi:DNA excision repair protein ERCC-2